MTLIRAETGFLPRNPVSKAAPLLILLLLILLGYWLRVHNLDAFSFSLTDNYPRLGYVPFLDAVMAVTFIFNTLVLLYNVYMKRLENQGQLERVAHIDRFLDWAYPFLYLGLIGIVALWFYQGGL